MDPKLRLSYFLLLLITLVNQPFLSLGEVKAPISTDTPIKLVNKREQILDQHVHHTTATTERSQQNSIQSAQEEVVALPAAGVVGEYEDTTTTTRSASSSTTTSEENVSPTVHLIIHEPPHESYIAGKHFFVGLQVVTSDPESERLVRAARDEYKVCISLDDGHYSCWSTNSTIVYANAIHGSHSLIAKLFKDGNLLDETASSLVTFTTVSDPTMNISGVEFHSQFSQPQANQNQHPDDVEETVDLDGNDVSNSTSSDDDDSSDSDDVEEGVHVSFPSVELLTPSDQVSYTGSDLIIDTSLKPQDPEQFSKYFQNSFTCFSIDMATAQSCFQLFRDAKPLMVGLDIGFHTIEASLTNPETLELLEASRSGMKTFFMAGQDNQGAIFTAEINLRGKLHQIPIVKGGSLVAQTNALCRSVGLAEQGICLDPVFRHLVMVGRQVGFIQDGGF
jgi:hypothetical protein